MGLTKEQLDFVTAEVVAGIYKPILALGGRIDQLRLEIIGTDTETGEPITIRINHETTRNWPDD